MSLVAQIHQTSGRRHQHIHAGLHRLNLGRLSHAAKYHCRTYRQIFSILCKVFLNLQGQLPGGRQNQGTNGLVFPANPALKPLQNGNGKGRRFPSTGLGTSNEVPPGQHMGDGGSLNGRGALIAHLPHRP